MSTITLSELKKRINSEVIPAFIEWRKGKKGISFNTETSINLVDDPELLKLMVDAGFDTVFVGIETPNEDSLTECSKSQNKGCNLFQNIRQLQHAGLQVQGVHCRLRQGFIFDLPTAN
jgi:hypothetical protein